MDIGTSLATEIVKCLGQATWEQARYSMCFDPLVEEFDEEKKHLEANIEDMEKKAKILQENTIDGGSFDKHNLNEAIELQTKADELVENLQLKKTCCYGSFPNLYWRDRLGRQVAEKTEGMKKLNAQIQPQQKLLRTQTLLGLEYYSSEDFILFNSTKKASDELLEALKDANIRRIGLCGMGGSGKTTLVKEVGKKAEKLFDKVVFVTVSRNFEVKTIQRSIADHLNLTLMEENEPERAKRLFMRLSVIKNILIILDDVWEELNFEDIGIHHRGCRILFTTRHRGLYASLKCKMVHLDLISEKEAWELFKKHAEINEDASEKSLKGLPPLINKACKGLPIAIAAFAKALKDKEVDDWEDVYEMLESCKQVDIANESQEPYESLQFSYNCLKDLEVKKLFLLCSLFPEDSEIKEEDLIRMGTGLGMFEDVYSCKKARIKGRRAIEMLLDSFLLLQAKEKNSVMMHDILRAVALKLANKQIQTIVEPIVHPSLMELPEHVAIEEITKLYCRNINEFPIQFKFPKLEVLIVCRDGEGSSEIPNEFLNEMAELKVLTINDRYSWQDSTLMLPKSIWSLKCLGTLCIRGCKLDFRFSLQQLENLKILEFVDCSIMQLPDDIVVLKNLKLLDVSRCRVSGNPYKVLGSCKRLEELYFSEIRLDEEELKNQNLGEFFVDYLTKLERYNLQIGAQVDKKKIDMKSGFLSICPYSDKDTSTSAAAVKALAQKAVVLFLENIPKSCQNVIPDIVSQEGECTNDLTELLLCDSKGIMFLIDTMNEVSQTGTIFSKLQKLSLIRLNCLEGLCHGEPPNGLFEQLEELECSQLPVLSSLGKQKLSSLVVLKLQSCPKLESLFTPAIAVSLVQLKELKITKCHGLKFIIGDEEEEDITNDNDQKTYASAFISLKELVVGDCKMVEYLIPLSFARSLGDLEVLTVYLAPNLKYAFGTHQSCSQNDINLPNLKKLELLNLEEIISFYPKNHNANFPEGLHLQIDKCPNFAANITTNAPKVDPAIEVQDNEPSRKAKVSGTSAVAQNIKDWVYAPISHACYSLRFNRYVEDLRKETEKLKSTTASLQDCPERETPELDSDVKGWLYNADTLIKEAEKLEQKAVTNQSCCFGRFPNWVRRYRMGKQAAGKIDALMKHNQCGEYQKFYLCAALPRMEDYFQGDFMFSDSIKSIYYSLLESLKEDDISLIGLHGTAGCGKTTLAKQVAKEAEQLFDRVIFVALSSKRDVRNIQQKIADSLYLYLMNSDTELERATSLFKRLSSGEKILMILDDIQDRFNLEDIGIPFGVNHKGCSVLIITRSQQVCIMMDCQRMFPMLPLSDEEAWFLLQRHAHITEDTNDSLKDVVKKVIRGCGGLPIALAAVASTLKGKTEDDWKEALKILQSPTDNEADLGRIHKCLQVSYGIQEDFENAKSLFLLCSVFPENFEIQEEHLMRYGIALGLFDEVSSYERARDQVREAKEKLIHSCLLLKESEGQCVRMHRLFRDAALSIANKEIVTLERIHEWQLGNAETIRYLWCEDIDRLPNEFYFPKLKFLYLGVSKNLNLLDEFVKGMKCLRVLVLCCKSNFWSRPNLTSTKSILSLPNLVGLFLEGWELGDISFLVRLNRLEALMFRDCSFREIPNEITELKKLQLLELLWCNIERNPYEAIGRCSQLQELYFIRNSCSEWNNRGENDAALFQEKEMSLNLERYRIEMNIYPLFHNVNFSTSRGLYLEYFKASTLNASFKNLVQRAEVLSLGKISGGCENIIPDMVQKIGEGINELIELQLKKSDEIKCITGSTGHAGAFFPCLTDLVLKDLNHLEALCCGPTPAGSFQKLKKLELSKCPLLESLFTVAVAQCLEMLQVISISECDRLKHIIWDADADIDAEEKTIATNDDNQRSISALPKLEELSVHKCQNLEYLGGHWLLTLNNLKVLNVTYCSSLKSLFTASTAKTMTSLEKLIMERCDSIKEVFGTPYVEDGQALTLSRLKMLRFKELPNLIEVSRGFKLQRVIDAEVDNCTNFQNLSQGQNTGLTKLTIRGSQVIEGWCRGPTPPSSFEILKKLEFCDCPSLKSLFTIAVAQSLKMLQVLKINKCHILKDIIWDVDTEAEKAIITIDDDQKYISAFPKLEELFVRKCKDLEYLGGHWLIKLCSLKVLDIRYCSSLKSLFTIFTAKTMTSLENLFIERCDSLMEVFGVPDGEDGQVLVLPKLKILQFMRLPNLIKVFHGFKMQHGIDAKIDDCPKFRKPVDGFQNLSQGQNIDDIVEAFIPGLTKLKIRRLHNTKSLCCGPTLADSFEKLKKLELHDCPSLKSLFTVAVAQSLEMLQVLRLIQCDGLKHIIKDDEAEQETITTFPKLEKLYVHDCKNLEYLGGYWLINLSTLKFLDIRYCSSLKSLSTISIAKTMASLENLFIERCDSLNEVFKVSNGIDGQALALPSLKIVQFMKLPNLIKASNGFKLQRVINVIVNGYPQNVLLEENSDEIQCLTDTTSHVGAFFRGLTKLSIQRLHYMEFLCCVPTPANSFENLKELQFWDCSSLKSLFTVAIAQSLETLQVLRVSSCHRLKHIIWDADAREDITPIDDDHKYISAFPNLEELYVDKCRDLEYLGGHWLFNFCSLKELNVTNCPRLKSLFTTTTAKTMTSLENLIIQRCDSIKEVFDVPYGEDGPALILPRLKTLRFSKLPNLIEVSHGFELQHVIKPYVQHCPEFHGSFLGLHNPSQGQNTDERKCITDTTGQVGAFYPSLSKLRIQRLHNKESLFSFQPPACSFEELKELELYNCPSLKSLFTVTVAQSLKMMQVLRIIECDKLKHIIWDEDANRKEEIITTDDDKMSTSAFSKLEELYVRDCKNLEDLGGRWLFNLCSLKVLDVRYCSSLKLLFTVSTAKTMMLLEKLFIERCDSLKDVFELPHGVYGQAFTLPKLKILQFMRLPNLIEASCGFKLQHVINVVVGCCPSIFLGPVGDFGNLPLAQNPDEIQCITDTTCPVGAFFPDLSKLSIQKLHNMESLSRVPTLASSFEKLKELELRDCSSLESLFTVVVAQNLEMLQVLSVDSCHRLKHIIWDANADVEKDLISAFPKLEVLDVQCCEELESVGGYWLFNLCNLKKLNVADCQRLKSLFTTLTAKTMTSLENLSIQFCHSLKKVFGVPYGDDDPVLMFPRLKMLRFVWLPNLIEVSHGFELQHGIEAKVTDCPYFRGPIDGFENMSQGQNSEQEGRKLDSESAEKNRDVIGQSTSSIQESIEVHNAIAGTSIIINTASSSGEVDAVHSCTNISKEDGNVMQTSLNQDITSSALIIALNQDCQIPDIKASSSSKATAVQRSISDIAKDDRDTTSQTLRTRDDTLNEEYQRNSNKKHMGSVFNLPKHHGENFENTDGHSVSKLKGTAIEEVTLRTNKQPVHVQSTLKIDQNVHGKSEDSEGQEFDSSSNAENAVKETSKESILEQISISEKQCVATLLLRGKDYDSQTATNQDVNSNVPLAATNSEYQTTVGGDNLKKMAGKNIIEQSITRTGIPLTGILESLGETPMASAQKGLPSEKSTAEIPHFELVKKASNSQPISTDYQEEAFEEDRVSPGNLPTGLDLHKATETIMNLLKFLEDYSYKGPRKEDKHEHPPDNVNNGANSSGKVTLELPSSVPVAQNADITIPAVIPALIQAPVPSVSLPPIHALPIEVEPMMRSSTKGPVLTREEEYSPFRDVVSIKKKHIPLLERAIASYPSLWAWHEESMHPKMKQFGYTLLGDMLEFLASTKWRDLTEQKKAEFESLLDGLERFGFDTQWLANSCAQIKQRKTINRMKMLEQQAMALESELDCIRVELETSNNFIGF